MEARVKATGEIIEVREVTKYDSNYSPIVYYKAENGFPYKTEHLDFEDLTQGKADVKEKSLPKDEPDYWEKLKHQYAGMAMQGILANCNHQLWEREVNSEGIAKQSYRYATALVNKLKEESK